MKQYLIILFVGIVIGSCAVRKTEPITGSVVSTDNPRVQHGEQLYLRYCYQCHPSGEPGLGPSVTTVPGFLTRFQARHGMGVMPAFDKDVLSKQDLKDIALYLKQLKKL